MRTIPLTQGKFALVDDVDYESIYQHRWYVQENGRTCYAMRCIRISKSKWQHVSMHRTILNAPRGVEVDHRNGNGLDNRRFNLRLCNHFENQRHQRLNRRNKTGLKGVTFMKRRIKSPYMARIMVNNKSIHLGCYQTAIAAARVYDAAAIKYHDKFALTNEMLGLI